MLKKFEKVLVMFFSILLIVSIFNLPASAATSKDKTTTTEPESKLHIMAIGSSNTYRYFIPHTIYKMNTLTSELIVEPGLPGKAVKYFIQEGKKNYNPELFMVDLRWFVKYAGEPKTSDSFLRTALKSVNRLTDSKIRSNAAYELLNHAKTKKSTKAQLKKKYPKWFSTKDSVFLKGKDNKGFLASGNLEVMKAEDYAKNEERLDLSKDTEKALRSLLKYVKDNKIKVLFTLSPYKMSLNNIKNSNKVQDIVEEYGFTMLNTNKMYTKLKVNFKTDFYNSTHMNINGAIKYSKYISNYLKKNFKFKTKLTDDQKKDWKNSVDKYNKVKLAAYEKLYPQYKKAKVLKYVDYDFKKVKKSALS